MESYSNEQGFCSYFRIVERGPNYKLLNINLFWKFLSVGRLYRCFHARRPSYNWSTFLCWTTFLYRDNISRLRRHYGQTGDSPIFGSPSLSIPLSSFKGWLISFLMFGDRLDTCCVCEKYDFYDEMSIKGDEFCGFEFSCLEILCWKVVLKDFVLVFA